MQQQLKFRISDLSSFAARRANEDAVVLAALQAGRGPFQTCGQCQCGRPREAVRATSFGNILVGCRGEGDHEHIVTVPLAAAGTIWPGSIGGSDAFDFNSAVAYGVQRKLDVPARFRGCVAGPVLIGGGTVYLPGDEFPTYPRLIQSEPNGKASEWVPADLILMLYRDVGDRFQIGIDHAAQPAMTVPVAIDEEFIDVRPEGKPRFRKRGAA